MKFSEQDLKDMRLRRLRIERNEKKRKCTNGNKICYNTRKKALKALNRSRTHGLKAHTRSADRVYACPYCQYWHLTKAVQRES